MSDSRKLPPPGGAFRRAGIKHTPGLAKDLLREMAPLLAEGGGVVITTSIAWMAVNAVVGLIGFAPGVDGARIAWEAHAFGFLFGILAIGPLARLFARPDERFDSPGGLGDPLP